MPKYAAFTTRANGISNVLLSKCGMAPPTKGKVDPKTIKAFRGIWDTGASRTAITAGAAKALGLQPTGKTTVSTATKTEDVNTYEVNIYLPNNVEFPFVTVTEANLNGADLLIGMDIIGAGDFAVTNANGKTTFTYRAPSVAEIDFVADANRSNFATQNATKTTANKAARNKFLRRGQNR